MSPRLLEPSMVKFVLGAVTGLITAVAMIRLIAGGFAAGLSWRAWTAVLLVMVPFIAYAAWRARHGRLSGRGLATVAVLDLLGLVLVWVLTVGPVLALLCALAAFVVIWVSGLPDRSPRGEEHFVRIDELRDGDEDE